MNSTKLKEITNTAKRGYISNPKEVEKIVNQFVNLTLDEIDNNSASNYKDLFGALPPSVGLSYEHLGVLTYLDLITLIGSIPHNDFFAGEDDDTAFNFRLFQIEMLKKMLMASKGSFQTQAFLSLNVKAFYDYLESRNSNKRMSEAYSNLAYQTKSYLQEEFNEAATIKELIQKVSASKEACWYPWRKKITQYQQHTLQGFNILELILIRSFKIGFKEHCNVDDIYDKYSNEEDPFEENPMESSTKTL